MSGTMLNTDNTMLNTDNTVVGNIFQREQKQYLLLHALLQYALAIGLSRDVV